ncbi:MAG: CBS domain-containing protein [Alphaproteobacteria bacterium]|nr:CBS domain-containing protein [Alphaproteobacteria bacterium]
MQCRHYMVRSVPTVADTATLAQALATMVKHHMQDLLVVNANGEFTGEISSFTLARLLLPTEAEGEQTREEAQDETVQDVDNRIAPHLMRRVADFAERNVRVMHPDTPLAEALKLLASGALRLPVVDPTTNKLLGAISSLTVLRRYQF